MPEPIYVVVYFAILLLKAVSLCMFARALLSFFELNPENKLVKLLYAMTEPAVMPIRKLFYKKNWFADMPIDMSFTFAFLLISVLRAVVENMIL